MIRKTTVKAFYQREDVISNYDNIRFKNKGGQYINSVEIGIVRELFSPTKKTEVILDIATGTGRFALMFAEMGYKVIALDNSFGMLKLLQEKAKSRNLEIICVRGNILNLPFKKKSFNGICCIRFLWHYGSWETLIKNIMDICNVFFVFDLMNKNSLRRLITPFANRVTDHKLLTQREIEDFFNKNNYNILGKCHAFFFPYIFYRKLPFLAKYLSRLEKKLLKKYVGTIMYYKIAKY